MRKRLQRNWSGGHEGDVSDKIDQLLIILLFLGSKICGLYSASAN